MKNGEKKEIIHHMFDKFVIHRIHLSWVVNGIPRAISFQNFHKWRQICVNHFFWIESKICTEKVSIGVNELFPDFLNAGVFNIVKFTFLRLFLHFINFSITICNLQMKESTKFVQFFRMEFLQGYKRFDTIPNFQELITNSIRKPIF